MMKLIKYTLVLFLFWLFCFFPIRLFFALYQNQTTQNISPVSDRYWAFVAGYKLDIATSTILCGLPMIAALLYILFGKRSLRKISMVLVGCLLALYIAVGVADAGIYKEWMAKVNVQALSHVSNPSEIIKTIAVRDQLLFIVLLLGFWIPLFALYKKFVYTCLPDVPNPLQPKQRIVYGLSFLALSAGVSVILIRGGITSLPMSQSAAYFSTSNMANDIAVNPLYNVLQDITVQRQAPEASQYHVMPDTEARQVIQPYFQVAKDSFPRILQHPKPNVVFLILESWSADLVSCLGGMPGCTPNIDSLSKEGILFEQCIASAYISDQGIPSIFSAYPGLSRISPISMPHVAQRMPSLPEDLKKENYSTLFFYGGDPVFGNIKGYVVKKGFDRIIDYKQLSHLPQGQLGVHDAEALPEFLNYCNTSKQPFLNAMFTLSTHMPYDFKTTMPWQGIENDPEQRYSASVHYADAALGAFFREAKKQAWYTNTLFVLVADHSHNTFRHQELSQVGRHRIPMLFVGDAIKPEYRGQRINKYVSQLDIVSTLCKQFNMQDSAYTWSRNMLNPYTPSAAYFPFFGGTGYIDSSGYASKYILGGPITSTLSDSNAIQQHYRMAQSFLQLIYKETME